MKKLGFRVLCLAVAAAALTTTAFARDQEAAPKNPHSATEASVPAGSTLENLQTGYGVEEHSSRRYAAYAVRADDEGFHQVASMFRAIARGEAIHAASLAAVLQGSGATPVMSSEPIVVMSTFENLDFAAADQDYEADVMYPAFIKQARKEGNNDAERIFHQALAAEPTHRTWYRQALEDLDGYRGENVSFFVCGGCGMTTRTMKEKTCGVCSSPHEKFEEVR